MVVCIHFLYGVRRYQITPLFRLKAEYGNYLISIPAIDEHDTN